MIVRIVACAMLALSSVAMVGCQSPSPVVEAGSVELKAQAVYAEYVLAEEAAARLMADPSVPDSVKARIQAVHAVTNPIAEELSAQLVLLAHLRVSKPDDVPGALLALNDLIYQLHTQLQNLRGVR